MVDEKTVRRMVAEFLQLKFPGIIYRFDLAADLKLTAGQARQHKHLHPLRGFPDLFIYEPRNGWSGLAIELKRPGTRLKKKDGAWASEHLAEQAKVLQKLEKSGYATYFAVGFDQTIEIIKNYLGGDENVEQF